MTTEDIYDNSYAIIIGIDKYQNVKNLNYAVKDAESIKNILVSTFNFPEGNITLLTNEDANKDAILKAFSDLTKKTEYNDRVLIYFAGHGETLDLTEGGERGYLLPVDGDKEDLYLTSIGMDELEKISEMSKAKHMLYLVDACYSGIAAVGSRGLDASSTPNYIKKITKNRGVQIITAGSRGEQVIEKSKWGHSAFTLNLNRGLKDGNADYNADGYITANELGMFLREKVTLDSENQQTPQYGRMTSQEGEFVFIYSENTIINKNIDTKSNDAKLDLLISEIKELKSQSKDENKLIDSRQIERDSIWHQNLVNENVEGVKVFGISLFSDSNKKIVNEQVKGGLLVTIFGDMKLNLVRANLNKSNNIIKIITIFGDCNILVPKDMYVDTKVLGIFGSFSNKSEYMMTDNKPAVKKLIIKGVTIFGDSSVRNKN